MCVVCGCADGGDGATQAHGHGHEEGHDHGHDHDHVHVDPKHGDLHFGAGAARVSVPGMSQARTVKLEADILGENRRIARQNRGHFQAHGVTALNLLSSPGSGKTTLLCATIEALKSRTPHVDVAVIEGDQQTSFDADRIRATGAPAVQVNTGKGCHLDAPMVAEAFGQLHSHDHHHHGHGEAAGSLLFIENVGNLVCPALWDLGEAAKVVVLSVTEGEDKPLKYPDMFAAAELMVLNKVDLLPHLRFDVQRCIDMARRVNPTLQVLQLSATTGQGMDAWLDWLLEWTAPRDASPHALRARVAALEAELAQARAALES
ncbi:hydrogenase nickel incorporation protein HypB [Pseudacidovorax intermedius]|uniref:Hydrogenase maturation factor HypB n=1 Tax=Pseudacidovorax intermedius TaxID=433924 RepID=A0A370FGU6_9BURK|nr:hydrogenase nickel incorporation protein HypB [Pseudacidovorax intermedius]RDI24280.1 hydrogenase nickel incorporation protein HypB [Pseudacidovorax intermedius]